MALRDKPKNNRDRKIVRVGWTIGAVFIFNGTTYAAVLAILTGQSTEWTVISSIAGLLFAVSGVWFGVWAARKLFASPKR